MVWNDIPDIVDDMLTTFGVYECEDKCQAQHAPQEGGEHGDDCWCRQCSLSYFVAALREAVEHEQVFTLACYGTDIYTGNARTHAD